MISIVCIYNEKNIFKRMVEKSLSNQSVEFELILIDNTLGIYKSATEALNNGARRARGEFIMFIHYDVEFSSRTWLEEAEKYLMSLPNLGIAGIAGARKGTSAGDREIVSNITDSEPPQRIGHVSLTEPERVHTLDECLFIIPRTVFKKLPFDEKVCNDWHLYAVDYCLSVKKIGLEVFALPLEIYHKSQGSRVFSCLYERYPDSYYRVLKRVLKKYKRDFKTIYTTCGTWDSSKIVFFQKYKPEQLICSAKRKIREAIKILKGRNK